MRVYSGRVAFEDALSAFVSIQVTYRRGLRGAEADVASLASEPSAPRKPLLDLYRYLRFTIYDEQFTIFD